MYEKKGGETRSLKSMKTPSHAWMVVMMSGVGHHVVNIAFVSCHASHKVVAINLEEEQGDRPSPRFPASAYRERQQVAQSD
jgi:hypothetical protein